MKFIVEKTSDYKYRSEVEIATLEDLMKWIDEQDSEIILGDSKLDELGVEIPKIEIYDDYRE